MIDIVELTNISCINKIDNENDEYVLQNQYYFREMRRTMCSKATMPKESRMPFV